MSTTSQARGRIDALLDENSFIEIGGRVKARSTDFNLAQVETPSDGVVTGYGVIDGNLVYVYAQDAAVLGGSIGEMHAKKIVRLYDLAIKTGAPVIALIDSAGLRLQEGVDALQAFGEIYLSQVNASGVVPQIAGIFGNCGGGLSVLSSLSDFALMEKKSAKLFLNAPNALDNNYTEKCDTAGAEFQSKEAGTVDFVGEEAEVLAEIRHLVTLLPSNNEANDSIEECTDDLNRTCEGLEGAAADPALFFTMISDSGEFFEVKRDYARCMVCGFIRLNGATVGAIGNRTVLFDENGKEKEKFDGVICAKGAEKAADFVKFCDSFDIPVLTVTDVKGFKACLKGEKRLPRAIAELTAAFAGATVPKVNVITGKAYGSAAVVMNSPAIGADLTIAWPDAEIGTMDAKLAAKILCAGDQAAEARCAADYAAKQTSVTGAAERGYVDEIIEPADTRKYIIGALEMLYTKRDDRPAKKHSAV
ncbi:MAG: carboxyl transferase [Lachnospiraceae bacterium]|nr:carboxyl transferase [Lachnospiraceae bacterium]